MVAGIAREDRPIVRSDISSRPAYQIFNFASGYSEIVQHAIIHAGEFNDGLASRQFVVDRLPYSFQDRKDSCEAEAIVANAFPLNLSLAFFEAERTCWGVTSGAEPAQGHDRWWLAWPLSGMIDGADLEDSCEPVQG